MIDGVCFDGTAATQTDDTITDSASGNALDESRALRCHLFDHRRGWKQLWVIEEMRISALRGYDGFERIKCGPGLKRRLYTAGRCGLGYALSQNQCVRRECHAECEETTIGFGGCLWVEEIGNFDDLDGISSHPTERLVHVRYQGLNPLSMELCDTNEAIREATRRSKLWHKCAISNLDIKEEVSSTTGEFFRENRCND